ncbi:hypothetical protein D3C81_2202780 [compost metagenome]
MTGKGTKAAPRGGRRCSYHQYLSFATPPHTLRRILKQNTLGIKQVPNFIGTRPILVLPCFGALSNETLNIF